MMRNSNYYMLAVYINSVGKPWKQPLSTNN